MAKSDFDSLLTVSGAAEFLQLSESWLNKARISGDGPRFIKMGRSVRYSLQALEEFKRANARGSTAEYECRPGPGRPVRGNARTLGSSSSLPAAPRPRLFLDDASSAQAGDRSRRPGSLETRGINGNVDESI